MTMYFATITHLCNEVRLIRIIHPKWLMDLTGFQWAFEDFVSNLTDS